MSDVTKKAFWSWKVMPELGVEPENTAGTLEVAKLLHTTVTRAWLYLFCYVFIISFVLVYYLYFTKFQYWKNIHYIHIFYVNQTLFLFSCT